MKQNIVIDSCFIIATIDASDIFHEDAIFIFNKLLKKSVDVKIIISPIVIYEVIATLIRKGLSYRSVEGAIMRLLHIEKIIMLSIAETSAFKHAKNILTKGDQSKSLRTSDFLITCIGIDFNALILTFDKKAYKKIKPIYNDIFYCSSNGNMIDETSDFLNKIGLIK
jgi:predicted nucleic acid-binding protein